MEVVRAWEGRKCVAQATVDVPCNNMLSAVVGFVSATVSMTLSDVLVAILPHEEDAEGVRDRVYLVYISVLMAHEVA